ncbi:MAG: Glycosyl transferase group 1 [Candidatus Jorgensenbacteria bacterium GW2011_GWA1_48_11]|uniref:Glycosyl transferase group 1 n=1 Tax=Candidatus Jorgensenbacteria bacterium GW2011_GWA1_48_11 TaxID=1618660 RepID=A0A0G1UBJ6_9BACT|nr:MAG: Glycosyl transferase group 1 [Candidatus Jorgensenbacteria bacterium GW2011_GWA1_48_11]KKW11982.1 MAG: Glycosyl transferase group 1 [Candidatus Jorgensenbacteria bacterium GW2011_GWB1_49_9]
MYKLAVLTSHPIQYQAPLFRKLAEDPQIDLTVYFCWDFGAAAKYDPEFGRQIKWDTPLLAGYKHVFLKNYSPNPSSGFWGQINPGIWREILRNEYSAVLIFGWNSLTNWLALAAAFWRRTPVFLRGENPLNQEFLKAGWKINIKKIILGALFRRISAFLYVGEENRKFYEYYGAPEEKLFFAPYAVDNARFIGEARRLSGKREILKKKIGLAPEIPVILFLGKLNSKKRPLDLLRAYEKSGSKDKALVFVGDGVLRPVLEKYAERTGLRNVLFEGFKNQTELAEYYALADVFVLPSGLGETWGLVVNEAMCFGLPVIVSDIAGCGPDLVRNGVNGFIFKSGDVNELADILGRLIADRAGRAALGKKSFEIVQKYSFDADIYGLKKALSIHD